MWREEKNKEQLRTADDLLAQNTQLAQRKAEMVQVSGLVC